MPVQPDALALLTAAHETFCRHVLPQLPPTARDQGEHVAHAMSIVCRDIASAGDIDRPPTRQVVDAIRAGAYDDPGPKRDALLQQLRSATSRQLAIDNPDYE